MWVSVIEFIKLRHPSYQISFCPNADTNNVLPLVDMPTLRRAKKLAEEYYKEWLGVNHNVDAQTENLYPLVERLEGRAIERMARRGKNIYGV